MRNLAPSEKRLLTILLTALFLAANMLGLRAFLKTRAKLQSALLAAKAELAEQKTWASMIDSFAPGESWITAHPIPALNADSASADLLKLERGSAESAGLKITEESLIPAATEPYGSTVGVSTKLSGPFPGVVTFLFAMQKPDAWRTVGKLALRSDAEPPNVVAELEIRQLFTPTQDALPSSSPSSPKTP